MIKVINADNIKKWLNLGDDCVLIGTLGTITDTKLSDTYFASFSADTRTMSPQALFVPLPGGNADGHSYIKTALEKGAVGSFTTLDFIKSEDGQALRDLFPNVVFFVVEDPLTALQETARVYRQTLDIPVIGITGSNGKTTTKNFIASILSKKFKVAYTRESFNNHIGLPLSILSTKSDDEILVCEIGTNHHGEISALASILKPTIGIVTNIGVAHIEYLGSRDGIANEKGDLPRCLPESGAFFVPKEDEYAEYLAGLTKSKKFFVETKDLAKGSKEETGGEGARVYIKKLAEVGIRAEHMVVDALLAIAIGEYFGIQIDEIFDALASTKYEEGRFMPKDICSKDSDGKEIMMSIIDDTYNANPDSVCAGIKAMKDIYPDRRRVLALGSLKEQGEYLSAGYQQIANTAEESSVHTLILTDIDFTPTQEEGSSLKIVHVKDNVECAEYIRGIYQKNDVVFFKGSKGAKMKEVIKLLSV